MAHHLDEPDHREVAHVSDEPRSLALHVLAAEPEHLEVREVRAEVTHQLAAVEVARGLAAGDEELRVGDGGDQAPEQYTMTRCPRWRRGDSAPMPRTDQRQPGMT